MFKSPAKSKPLTATSNVWDMSFCKKIGQNRPNPNPVEFRFKSPAKIKNPNGYVKFKFKFVFKSPAKSKPLTAISNVWDLVILQKNRPKSA